MMSLLRQTLVVALVLSSAACGPEPLGEPETWMLGTFSASRLGCNTAGFTTRYVVHEDGRFTIQKEGAGTRDREWRAVWEQRARGRYRVMRDKAFSDAQFYPIEEGTEWEVTRSTECDDVGRIRHKIDTIDLQTGERDGSGGMSPGAVCSVIPEEGGMCGPDFRNEWCEGTEPPPECDAE